MNDISELLNNKNYCIGILIDLSKALDTIDRKLLITKMQYYGKGGIVLDWFISYLRNLTQYVNINNSNLLCLPIKRGVPQGSYLSYHINNSNSLCLLIKWGVPQGSILGLLLFILSINDIVNVSTFAKYIMFADDGNLFFSNTNLNLLYNIINDELSLISNWFKLDKLSLNIKKTNYILFCSGDKKIDKKAWTY